MSFELRCSCTRVISTQLSIGRTLPDEKELKKKTMQAKRELATRELIESLFIAEE